MSDSEGVVYLSFTAIVRGDCTGDGLANSGDVAAMRKAIKRISDLEDVYFKAVDSNEDSVLSTLDYIREKILIKTAVQA